jgi:hypothetical protein
LQVLLDPTRAARLERSGAPGFAAIASGLLDASWYAEADSGVEAQIRRQTSMQVMYGLLGLAFDANADTQVRALALAAVQELDAWLAKRSTRDTAMRAHYAFARHEIARLLDDPAAIETLVPPPVPPGSPIGSFPAQAGL